MIQNHQIEKKYEKIRLSNLHKMEPIPIIKFLDNLGFTNHNSYIPRNNEQRYIFLTNSFGNKKEMFVPIDSKNSNVCVRPYSLR